MKLKPIALAIPMVLAAGSLSAAEIYNKDGNSVELGGWAKAFGNVLSTDAQKEDDKGNKVDIEEGFHVLADAELELKATHQIDEASKVIGSFVIKAGDSTDGNAEFGDIKFEYDHTAAGNFSIGETGNSFGAIEKADAGNGDNLYAIGQGGVDGQGLRYKKSVSNFNFSANYETDSDSNNDANYALSGEYTIEDSFSVALAYGSDGKDASSMGLGADVTFGQFKLATAFVSFEDAKRLKVNDDLEVELDLIDGESYALTAQYELGETTFYASFQAAEGEVESSSAEAVTYYVGADYKITDSIVAYAVAQQIAMEKTGQDDIDATNFKFGAKYSF